MRRCIHCCDVNNGNFFVEPSVSVAAHSGSKCGPRVVRTQPQDPPNSSRVVSVDELRRERAREREEARVYMRMCVE